MKVVALTVAMLLAIVTAAVHYVAANHKLRKAEDDKLASWGAAVGGLCSADDRLSYKEFEDCIEKIFKDHGLKYWRKGEMPKYE